MGSSCLITDFRAQLRCTGLVVAKQHPTSSLIAVLDTNSKAYLFDLKTLAFASGTAGVLSLASNGGALAFIDTNRVFVWLASGAPYSVDFTGGGTVTALTTQSISPFNFALNSCIPNLTASQISVKKAIGISSSTAQFITVDNSGGGTPVMNKFTITGFKSFQAVIPSPLNTANYIAGTSDGFIYDVSFTGTVNKSFQLPLTPTKSGSALAGTSLPSIYSLTMDPTGTFLYVAASNGFRYKYLYSTNTLLEQWLTFKGSTTTPIMSEIVNNQFMAFSGRIGFSSGMAIPINLIGQGTTFGSTPTMELDYLPIGPGWQNFAGAGINAAAGVGWILVSGGFDQTGNQILVFGMDGLAAPSPVLLDRKQEPIGTDINFRSVKIGYVKSGVAFVESDTSVPSGSQTAVFAQDNQHYYELALSGSQGVDEAIDFRKVQV